MPFIKMKDGVRMDLTDEQAENVMRQRRSGAALIRVAGAQVTETQISGVYPDGALDRQMNYGCLHDGTQVVRRFGLWVDPERPDVVLSPRNYPEIAKDELMTIEGWRAEILPLPTESERAEKYKRLAAPMRPDDAGQRALPPGDA